MEQAVLEQPYEIGPSEDAMGVFRKTICLQLTIHGMGNTRGITEIDFPDADMERWKQGGAKKDLLKVSKKLVDAPEYRDMSSQRTELNKALDRKSLPASILKSGHRLIPLANIEAVDEAVQTFIAKRKATAEQLATNWDGYVDKAREALGVDFNPADYPHRSEVAEKFTVEYRYVNIASDPSKLQSISGKLFQREVERARQEAVDFAQEVKRGLLANTQELVQNLVQALEVKPGEPAKGFRKTHLDKIAAFCSEFDELNVADYGELREQIALIRRAADGVDPAMLRESELVTKLTHADFQKIQSSLMGMIEEMPARRMRAIE